MYANDEHARASLPRGAASVSLNSLSPQNLGTDAHPTRSVPREISPLIDWAYRHAAAARAAREERAAVSRAAFLGDVAGTAPTASSIRTRHTENSNSQHDNLQHDDSRPTAIRRDQRGDTRDATLPYVVVAVIVRLVRITGFGIAGVLVLRILFLVLRANPDSGVGILMARLAGVFSLGLSDLFTLTNPVLSEAVHAGVSVLVWLGIVGATSALLHRFLQFLSDRGDNVRN